jgi:hypothetical protein
MWSPHYADQLGMYRHHRVPTFPFSRAAVDGSATARLLLTP